LRFTLNRPKRGVNLSETAERTVFSQRGGRFQRVVLTRRKSLNFGMFPNDVTLRADQ